MRWRGIIRVPMLSLFLSGFMLATPAHADTGVIQIAKLLAPNAAAGEFFGDSVAISGDLIVVGCPKRERQGEVHAGTVFVYRMIDGVPVFEAELSSVVAREGNQFGRAVEVDGDRILINDFRGTWIFHHDGKAWIEEQWLPSEVANFGKPGTIWKDRAVVTNTSFFFEFISLGKFSMYAHNGESWNLEQYTEEKFDPDSDSLFGNDIEMNDEFMAIGIPHFDTLQTGQTGAVWVYRRLLSVRSHNTWTFIQTITPDDAIASDTFGLSLDLTANRMIVGSPRTDGEVERSGAAYVYRFNGEQWELEQKLTDSESEPGDLFGYSVAFDGDIAIVGVAGGDRAGLSGAPQGYARMFRHNGSAWVPGDKVVASDRGVNDLFGDEVAISGGIAVVGTYADDDQGEATGSVWVFRICGSDINTDGVIDTADLGILLANYGKDAPAMDYNADGIIDSADLGILISEFGSPCP